jgi:hypothetical protein
MRIDFVVTGVRGEPAPYSADSSLTVRELMRALQDKFATPHGEYIYEAYVSAPGSPTTRTRLGRTAAYTRLADHPVLRSPGARIDLVLRRIPAGYFVLAIAVGLLVFLGSVGVLAFLAMLVVRGLAGRRKGRPERPRSKRSRSARG